MGNCDFIAVGRAKLCLVDRPELNRCDRLALKRSIPTELAVAKSQLAGYCSVSDGYGSHVLAVVELHINILAQILGTTLQRALATSKKSPTAK